MEKYTKSNSNIMKDKEYTAMRQLTKNNQNGKRFKILKVSVYSQMRKEIKFIRNPGHTF